MGPQSSTGSPTRPGPPPAGQKLTSPRLSAGCGPTRHPPHRVASGSPRRLPGRAYSSPPTTRGFPCPGSPPEPSIRPSARPCFPAAPHRCPGRAREDRQTGSPAHPPGWPARGPPPEMPSPTQAHPPSPARPFPRPPVRSHPGAQPHPRRASSCVRRPISPPRSAAPPETEKRKSATSGCA